MRRGGPLEHRWVLEDDNTEGDIICRVCGYVFSNDEDEPGCPSFVNMGRWLTQRGGALEFACDWNAAALDFEERWKDEYGEHE